MGGGIRGQRQSYAAGTNAGPTLDRYINRESSKRVFISFHMEDEAQVQLLRQQAKDERYDIEFIDYSVKEPFDEKWKTQATERIEQSSVFFVMIGPETYKRDAVIWEINKAYELRKKVVGIRIYKNKNHQVPEPLLKNRAKIIDWNLEDLSSELKEED